MNVVSFIRYLRLDTRVTLVHTINAYPNVNMRMIITHKYKDSLTLRHPPNINIDWYHNLIPTSRVARFLWYHYGMLFLRMIHSLIYMSNDGTYHHAYLNVNMLVVITHKYKDPLTFRHPPNINILLVSQFLLPTNRVGSLIPLWMSSIRTIHSLIY
jgi:hypothetical protein